MERIIVTFAIAENNEEIIIRIRLIKLYTSKKSDVLFNYLNQLFRINSNSFSFHLSQMHFLISINKIICCYIQRENVKVYVS